jgi:DNA-binding response OmpR family regulator
MANENIRRILVVDDEDDVRNYLATALKDAGFEVDTASDGATALDKIKQHRPDLVSLDLVMPKHSGVKLYRDLQKDRNLSSLPVLVVTGHARDDLGKTDFDEMTMSGPGVYLEKPVSPRSYVSAVKKLLGMESMDAETGQEPDDLRSKLADLMRGADPDALKRAMEALKKREQ